MGLVVAEDSFYPTTIGSLTAQVKLFGNGTISGLKTGEEVKFQTLTFPESEFQKVKIIEEVLIINGNKIYPKYTLDEFNNKYVSFTITQNGDFTYELIAEVSTSSIIYKMSDYNLGTITGQLKLYTEPSEKVESDSTEIVTLTKNKLLTNSFLDTLNKTILWVNDYVEYAKGSDFQKYYLLQKSAVDTLLSRKGVCDEFANLAAAMLRAKGLPTRLNIGVTFDGQLWGNHAWISVYHEKYGWIPSDPTFRESGFADATHISLGSYNDVTLSIAKAYFPQTANVTFGPQPLPEVKIISKQYFDEVQLESDLSNLTANKWNEVPLKVTNKTNGVLVIPISIKETYAEFIIQEKKKSVILNPGESQIVTFKLFPNLQLSQNQLAKGFITFNSLSSPYTKEFTLVPGTMENEGEIVVNDITPIAHEGTLKIQVITTNFYPTDKTFDLNIKDGTFNLNSVENISSFQSKTTTKEIPDYNDDAYYVTITTPTTLFSQTIVPQQQKVVIVPKEPVKETVIEQKIQHENETNITDKLVENPIIIIIALVMGTAVMLFGLFWVNKRYV